MKCEVTINGIHLHPESVLDNEILKSWENKEFRPSFTFHCYPPDRSLFSFDPRGSHILTGGLYFDRHL